MLPVSVSSPTPAVVVTPLGILGIVLAYRIVPLCHCEERSDVAIRRAAGVSTSPPPSVTATPLGSLGIVLAYRIVPLCHCEERSDVAIRPQKTPSRFHLLETQSASFCIRSATKAETNGVLPTDRPGGYPRGTASRSGNRATCCGARRMSSAAVRHRPSPTAATRSGRFPRRRRRSHRSPLGPVLK